MRHPLHCCLSLIATGLSVSGLRGAEPTEDAVTIGHWGNNLMITAPAHDSDHAWAARLEQRITLNAKDLALSEVAEFLRRASGCTIVIDPALATSDPHLTITVEGMALGHVLNWMAELGGCHWTTVDGAIYLSQKPFQGAARTVLYDVSDLIMPVHDFPGPDLQIPDPAGHGARLQVAKDDESKPSTSIDELEDFLRTTVATSASH